LGKVKALCKSMACCPSLTSLGLVTSAEMEASPAGFNQSLRGMEGGHEALLLLLMAKPWRRLNLGLKMDKALFSVLCEWIRTNKTLRVLHFDCPLAFELACYGFELPQDHFAAAMAANSSLRRLGGIPPKAAVGLPLNHLVTAIDWPGEPDLSWAQQVSANLEAYRVTVSLAGSLVEATDPSIEPQSFSGLFLNVRIKVASDRKS
jgi:hypothetical protein